MKLVIVTLLIKILISIVVAGIIWALYWVLSLSGIWDAPGWRYIIGFSIIVYAIQ